MSLQFFSLEPGVSHVFAVRMVRLIQALAARLKGLVFWKKLLLRDGQVVYALCFSVRIWDVDPVSKELKLR